MNLASFAPLPRIQCKNSRLNVFRSFSALLPSASAFLSPSLARFRRGHSWCPLKTTPTGRLAARAFIVKGERPDRTAEHKKKTMKTNTNKNQIKAQSRPEQLSTNTEKRAKIDYKKRFANRALDTTNLLALLRSETPNLFELAEVVGKWVWIQFSDKQPSEVTRVLAEFGFHWNNTRKAWQHPCGTIADERATYDPRKRYGSYFAADRIAA